MLHRTDGHDLNAKAPGKDAFFAIGKDVTAGDFPLVGGSKGALARIIEIPSKASINDAFHTLVRENVLSAPVWDEEKEQYLGFLDIMDILALAIGVDMLMSIFPGDIRRNHESILKESGEAPDAKRVKEDEIEIGSLFWSSEGDHSMISTKWCPVTPKTPLRTILLLLATQTRRVPVIGENGRVINIISQSAIVSELYHHILAAGDQSPKSFLMETPRSSGIGTKKVITVDEDTPAKEAFAMMIENRISAVGILDSEHKHLITCISTKDVRLLPVVEHSALAITSGSNNVLNMPCRLYAAAIRRVMEKTGKARPAVVCAGLDTPIRLIIGKLAETRMHRVFIVDPRDVPIGVISVSDILQLLVEQQNWEGE